LRKSGSLKPGSAAFAADAPGTLPDASGAASTRTDCPSMTGLFAAPGAKGDGPPGGRGGGAKGSMRG